MQNQLKQVKDFMTVTGQTINEVPTVPEPKDKILRYKLMTEESEETLRAETPLDALDGIVDQLYVLFGTIHTYGFSYEQITEAFARVHANNMTKVQPDGTVLRNAEGKIIKPEGFEPVDLSPVLGPNPITIEGWLKRIPCPVIRKMALERMKHQTTSCNSIGESIYEGWTWGEEYGFWVQLCIDPNQTFHDLKHLLSHE